MLKITINWFLLDVNECTFGMHSCDDSTRADCINTEGSYECVCKADYIGNGESCIHFGINHSIKSTMSHAAYREYLMAKNVTSPVYRIAYNF